MWVDATSAAGYIYNPKESQVADKTAFTAAPIQVTANGSGWFWAWSLGIPASSKKVDAAKSFVKWATSKDYIAMVGGEVGWVAAPPGTRKSTYDNPEYVKAAPFAKVVYEFGQERGHHEADQGPGSLCRHPVCRDPRVPGHRHGGRATDRRGARGAIDRRSGARDGAALDGAYNEAGGLSEIGRSRQPIVLRPTGNSPPAVPSSRED